MKSGEDKLTCILTPYKEKGSLLGMARLPRLILPNTPHHITQRGNRRQKTFFCDQDYQIYHRNLLEVCESNLITIEAYCLMPNHVHLVLTPPSRESLVRSVAELHRRYTAYINTKNNWRGHLWQGRFYSVPLSPNHFENCLRYVEQNPVRAGLIDHETSFEWRSHRTHSSCEPGEDFEEIRKMTRTGRPRGDESFLKMIQETTGIDPRPRKTGPKV